MQMVYVQLMLHPDENWQSLEVAYDILYGKRGSKLNKVEPFLSWEFDKNYCLRNHLYPLWLSMPGFLLKWTGLDSNLLIVNSMYAMHCVLWVFGDFYFFHLVKQISGKRCAVLGLIIFYSYEEVTRYCTRVNANGVEGSFVIAAMYYFFKIKPEIFDANLQKMTCMITLCFIARSSSLVPWIPLAALKIIEDASFFIPIVVSGLTITIPLCFASILIDSYLYGVISIPQLNFMKFNVVENGSKFFGSDVVSFYLDALPEMYCCPLFKLGLFGLSLISVKQMLGTLHHFNRACAVEDLGKPTRIPVFLVYSMTYLYVLSSIDHKEHRFLTPFL